MEIVDVAPGTRSSQGSTGVQGYFKANLNPLNHSGAEGHAILHPEDDKLDTKIYSTGMAPKLPTPPTSTVWPRL